MIDLRDKMMEFIEIQDGDYFDDWYGSPRDFAANILTEFAEFMGIELVVPEHVPRMKKPEVDRKEMLEALLPGLRDLFDIEYRKRTEGDV